MIISGGVNIFPAEIEVVIIKHPEVTDAAVIGVPDEDYGEITKAFCQLKEGSNLTREDIMNYCKKEMVIYKVPRLVEFVSSLPYSTVGKVLKRQLRDGNWENTDLKV